MILIKISYTLKAKEMNIYAFYALFIRIYATNSFFLLKIQRKVNLQVIQQDIHFISFNTLHILSVRLRYVSRQKNMPRHLTASWHTLHSLF